MSLSLQIGLVSKGCGMVTDKARATASQHRRPYSRRPAARPTSYLSTEVNSELDAIICFRNWRSRDTRGKLAVSGWLLSQRSR